MQKGISLVPEPLSKESLDAKWYQRFLDVGSFQAYAYLDGDSTKREAQKIAFLSGEIEQPKLDYPSINPTKLHKREQGLLSLKADIIAEEQHPAVKRAYVWKISEKLAEVRLLKATLAGNDIAFKKYTEFVYGKPSAEVFVDDCQIVRDFIVRCQATGVEDYVKCAALDLALSMPMLDKITEDHMIPTVLLIDQVREKTRTAMEGILSQPEGSFLYTAEQISNVFSVSLEKLGLTDRKVIIDTSSKSTISVNQESKTIRIPQERKLTPKKLQLLIAHEIGTHVMRRVQGEKSPLQLLGLGLDRYERGEEGIATMREQVLDEEYEDDVGLSKHIAISLAYGLDGKPRNFRQVFDFLYIYYKLVYLADGLLIQRAEYLAKENAWKSTVRTFRGTHGTLGVCFTKDCIYREGNLAVRDLLATDATAVDSFSVGKYDPTNPRHVAILEELGIL